MRFPEIDIDPYRPPPVQAGAITGRMTVSTPNITEVPKLWGDEDAIMARYEAMKKARQRKKWQALREYYQEEWFTVICMVLLFVWIFGGLLVTHFYG